MHSALMVSHRNRRTKEDKSSAVCISKRLTPGGSLEVQTLFGDSWRLGPGCKRSLLHCGSQKQRRLSWKGIAAGLLEFTLLVVSRLLAQQQVLS